MADVDELVSGLASGFQVTTDQLSTETPHPRFAAYYKSRNWTQLNQESRRRNHLDRQHERRFDQQTLSRKLAMEDFDEADLSDDGGADGAAEERMDTTPAKAKSRYYRNQLMLAEWLVDLPTQMDDDWLALLCPEGSRCLVIAARGVTTSYNKAGRVTNQFPSHLPGGRHASKSGYSLLDCIYSAIDRKYFVIDLMCWKSTPIFDSDTEFRFFWLASKLSESPDLAERTSSNPYPFESLPYCKCAKEDMEALLAAERDWKAKVDGLLFYHRRANYVRGRTPLVGWLKPFMLAEVLRVDVPAALVDGHDGERAADYVARFNETHERCRYRASAPPNADDGAASSS